MALGIYAAQVTYHDGTFDAFPDDSTDGTVGSGSDANKAFKVKHVDQTKRRALYDDRAYKAVLDLEQAEGAVAYRDLTFATEVASTEYLHISTTINPWFSAPFQIDDWPDGERVQVLQHFSSGPTVEGNVSFARDSTSRTGWTIGQSTGTSAPAAPYTMPVEFGRALHIDFYVLCHTTDAGVQQLFVNGTEVGKQRTGIDNGGSITGVNWGSCGTNSITGGGIDFGSLKTKQGSTDPGRIFPRAPGATQSVRIESSQHIATGPVTIQRIDRLDDSATNGQVVVYETRRNQLSQPVYQVDGTNLVMDQPLRLEGGAKLVVSGGTDHGIFQVRYQMR